MNLFDQIMAAAGPNAAAPGLPAPTVDQGGDLRNRIMDAVPIASPQETAPAPTVPAAPAKPDIAGIYKRKLGDAREWESSLTPESIGRGVTDLRDAGSQLIGKSMQAVAPKDSAFEQWAKAQTDIVEKRNAEGEAEYQKTREGRTGVDSGRLAGNVLATLPFASLASRGIPMRVAGNAASGGASSALSQPVPAEESGDSFWKTKAKQTALGGAGAVAMMPVAGAAARVVSPNASTDPTVQRLLRENIRLTPGQILGGFGKRAEDAGTSAPILGDAIRNAQRGGIQDLNRAAYNRVLEPLNETLPRDMRMGRDAVDYVQRRVSDSYQTLLPQLSASADNQFVGEATQILQRLQATDPNLARQFGNTFQTLVVDRFAPQGQVQPITGQMLKTIESDLGRIASGYRTSANGGERMLGGAVGDLMTSFRELVTRSNPNHAGELQRINEAFRRLVVTDKAAGSQGAVEGVFTPNQLSAAVKSSDRSARDRNFAAGRATMQDLSDAAKSVMPSSVPDSGTPFRTFLNSGLIGQVAALPMLAATPAYTRPGLAAMEALLARRPRWAGMAANGLRTATPALGAAAAQSLYGPR